MIAGIRDKAFDPEAPRVLKLKVSAEACVRLQHYRLLHGVTVSNVVEQAITAFFEERAAARAAGGEFISNPADPAA